MRLPFQTCLHNPDLCKWNHTDCIENGTRNGDLEQKQEQSLLFEYPTDRHKISWSTFLNYIKSTAFKAQISKNCLLVGVNLDYFTSLQKTNFIWIFAFAFLAWKRHNKASFCIGSWEARGTPDTAGVTPKLGLIQTSWTRACEEPIALEYCLTSSKSLENGIKLRIAI